MSEWYSAEQDIFNTYILGNAPPQKIGSGFLWTEGPVWIGDGNCLLFSDIPNSRVNRWIPNEGISTYKDPSDYSNGHTRDKEGRLISCEHGTRRVTRTEYDGSITVIADEYDGKRLNSPNEVVVKSDGTIWFSDPYYGIQNNYEGYKSTPENPCNVYRCTPDETGNSFSIEVMITGWMDPVNGEPPVEGELNCPNGLAFSPTEDKLYVADTGRVGEEFLEDDKAIFSFDCAPDGSLSNKTRFYSPEVGQADGFRLDTDGNLWVSSGEGVHCVSPQAQLVGRIFIPETVSNVVFGGRDRFQLFMASSTSLYMISLNRSGATWPDQSGTIVSANVKTSKIRNGK